MITIGVDPGLTGALALLTPAGLQDLQDMPVMPRGAGTGTVKNQVNAAALLAILAAWTAGHDKNEFRVLIELQAAIRFPGEKAQGGSSIFSLGLTAGIIEGVVAASGLPHELVPPGHWKKAMGLTGKVADVKGRARTLAQRMYPGASLARVKDHNRAEAILIARYGHDKYH